jgi:hypothetical protein
MQPFYNPFVIMTVAKRIRSWFFQETAQKSPRNNSVRFGPNHDPSSNTFKNLLASCVNILEDASTTTSAGIVAQSTPNDVDTENDSVVLDGVTYPLSTTPKQLPVVEGDTGLPSVYVAPMMDGSRKKYIVSLYSAGETILITDTTLAGLNPSLSPAVTVGGGQPLIEAHRLGATVYVVVKGGFLSQSHPRGTRIRLGTLGAEFRPHSLYSMGSPTVSSATIRSQLSDADGGPDVVNYGAYAITDDGEVWLITNNNANINLRAHFTYLGKILV